MNVVASSDDIAERYELFLEEVDHFGPDRAAARLRRMGVPEEILVRVVERFEHEVAAQREASGPVYVQAGGRFTWYTGPRPADRCWPALAANLAARPGWTQENLRDLDAASTRILGLLEHPMTTSFRTKGLALGLVQSGKTTNYTAVMAKAADRGYRLFVVLAGVHNELRRQTHTRLVEELVEPNSDLWFQITEEERDFTPPANARAFFAGQSGQPLLCVIKKNALVLRKFLRWLEEAGDALDDVPALVIDDEADQAAVATRTINPLIRDVIGALPRAAYIGYTATPFANLLIDPSADDLYPRDFIVDLPKPQGHYGTEVIFGRDELDGEGHGPVDGYDMVRIVPDHEVGEVKPLDPQEVDFFTPRVGGQLRQAVLWFWLASAARRVRGTGVPHSTMLVHTSVRVPVHESFRRPLERLRERVLEGWGGGDADLMGELRQIWAEETARVRAEDFSERPVTFDEIAEHFADVLESTRVVLDNSMSADRLDYRSGPQVAIAVGGNTLSRGLTLEGLVSSFFVRSSTAYDTLLQMGRWFGFRDGYADLPRIWMTDELRRWFRHIAGVETEVRRDVAVYMSEDHTPETFAVRIRSHPALTITSAAKMRDAKPVSAAYGGQRVQTRYFRVDDPEWLETNQRAARELVNAAIAMAAGEERLASARLWRDVPVDAVLGFLSGYRFHELSQQAERGLLLDYVEKRMAREALKLWNVAVLTNGSTDRTFEYADGVTVPTIVRARLEGTSRDAADIKTLMSRRDAALDLGVDGGLTEAEMRELRTRRLPGHGLIALYAVDRDSPPARRDGARREALGAETEVIGVGLVFPDPPRGERDAYAYFAADLDRIPAPEGYVEEDEEAQEALEGETSSETGDDGRRA